MPNHSPKLLAVLLSVALSAAVTACDAPIKAGEELQVTRQGLLPVIDTLEPSPAKPGDEVTIHGYFHKLRKDQGLFVSFNGIDSRQVTLVSDSELKAVVPDGASSGNVVVVIGESVGKGLYLKIHDKKQKD